MLDQVADFAFWKSLGAIIWVNLLLSGDNAVVIALAARSLPAKQQTTAVFWGSAAAIVLRIVLTIFAVALLQLPWLKLAGGALLMVAARRDTHEVLKLVDWHLLVFFAALFVVVEGLNGTGLPDQTYDKVRGLFGTSTNVQAWNFAWFAALGSNVFSNVPFVLVAGKWIGNFAQPELMWKVMALTTTLAGNLTILSGALAIIAVGALITVIQRILHVRGQAKSSTQTTIQ